MCVCVCVCACACACACACVHVCVFVCAHVHVYVCVFMSLSPCSDGMGRTGTFVCIHAMLERMNAESVVDFFQFVKSSRISRPDIVREQVCIYCCELMSVV